MNRVAPRGRKNLDVGMMTTEGSRLDGRSLALLLALATLWSLSFIFIKVAAAEIPAVTLALARVALAALVLLMVALAGGMRFPAEPAFFVRYAIMGITNNAVPFALIVYATSRLGAGPASILNATAPIFALVVAHFTTADEKITPAKLGGILLGVAGVAAMTGPHAVAGLSADFHAVAAMLTACFFYGLSAVYGRRFSGIDPAVSAACQLSAAALVLTPAALILDRPWTLATPSAEVLFAVCALAVASTALAYVIYYALIARAGSTNTILVKLLIPVGGVALGVVLLGEAFSSGEATGTLLIALALIVIDGRALRRFRAVGGGVRPAP